MEVSLSTYPNSGISGSTFVFRERQSIEFPIELGAFVSQPLALSFRSDLVDFELGIRTKEAYVGVLAKSIPSNAHLHIIGVTRNNFIGLIEHAAKMPGYPSATAPRCELRCTPNDKPVTGPGCISCIKGTLRFRVCC